MGEIYSMVTVTGLPGTGTTTVCGLLQRELHWEHLNAGAIFRQLAAEAGLGLVEFGHRAETDGAIDRALDARMVARAQALGQVILEGRFSGWMALRHGLPALRCWLDAPVEVRAARVSRRDGQELGVALTQMRRREESEVHRSRLFHGIDLTDLSIYHQRLDTRSLDPEQVASRILTRLRGEGP